MLEREYTLEGISLHKSCWLLKDIVDSPQTAFNSQRRAVENLRQTTLETKLSKAKNATVDSSGLRVCFLLHVLSAITYTLSSMILE